jgi:hypothetical protein
MRTLPAPLRKGADLKPKMRGVVQSFDAELNKRKTGFVKPDG